MSTAEASAKGRFGELGRSCGMGSSGVWRVMVIEIGKRGADVKPVCVRSLVGGCTICESILYLRNDHLYWGWCVAFFAD